MQSETRIHLVVHDERGTKTIVPRVHDELSIGTGIDNRIQVFGDDVAPHHARFVARDGTHLIDNLECERVVTVNGRPVQGVELLRAGDRVGIGACVVEVAAGTPDPGAGLVLPHDEPRAPGLLEGPPLLREEPGRARRRPGPGRPFFVALVLAGMTVAAIKSHTGKQREAERAAAHEAIAQRAARVETDTSPVIGVAQAGGSARAPAEPAEPEAIPRSEVSDGGAEEVVAAAEPVVAAPAPEEAPDVPQPDAVDDLAPAPRQDTAADEPRPRVRARNGQERRRAHRSASAMPQRASVLEVARMCLANGDQWCAIRALRKRAKSAPEIALLAETYLAVGRRTEALDQMARYLALYPRERHARRFRNRVGKD